MQDVTIQKLTPERRREMTRTALVEAAAEVFARRGFHASSLEEIAETAGFTRGAIYSNFGSKEDLLLAVVEWTNRKHVGAFADELARGSDESVRDRTASAALLWRDVIRRDPTQAVLHLEFQSYAMRNPEFRKRLVELERAQVQTIADLITRESKIQGLHLALPAEDLAEILNAATIGLTEAASVDVENAERYDRLVESFFVLMGKAISAEQPSATPPKKRSR
jgi:AcrR family transcriptional regulator